MTLRLSDDQLARLRLECLRWAFEHVAHSAWETAEEVAEQRLAWCLRDRPVEPEET